MRISKLKSPSARLLLLGGAALLGFSSVSAQQAGDVGAGAQVGTLGLGGHLRYQLNDLVSLRGEIQGGVVDAEVETDDADYEGDLDLFSAGIIADFQPWRNEGGFLGNLRLSAGLYGNGNKLDLEAVSDIEVGDNIFNIETGEFLDAKAEYNAVAPYLGIGYDWYLGQQQQVILFVDLGLYYIGDPEVKITGNPLLLSLLGQDSLLQEIEDLEDELGDVTFYPVLKLGVTWRF